MYNKLVTYLKLILNLAVAPFNMMKPLTFLARVDQFGTIYYNI